MAEQNSEIENLRRMNEDLAKQLRDAMDKIGELKQLRDAMDKIRELSQIVKEKNASASNHESPVYPINSGSSTAPSAAQNSPILNTPIPPSASDTQNQVPPPPPLGTYSFTPLLPTTSGGSPSTTQQIPPPIYTVAPPVPRFAPTNPVIVPDEQFEREIGGAESQKILNQIEERLKVMEGTHTYGTTDAYELSLVDGLAIPKKFKVPEFEKYKGTTCPKDHVAMYCRKMAAYSRDDQLLIHCFQHSLTGSAIRWYNKLDRRGIHSWNDLARAFIDQYKYMTDLVLDRLTLQNMEKKSSESFTEYAQRWRDMATQIQPPLTEKEMSWLFINTLKAPYYFRMLAGGIMSFTDTVLIGEMVENALRTDKLDDGESSEAKESSKEKKGEVSTIRCGGYQQHPQPQCQQCQPQYHSADFTPPQNIYQYPPPNYTQPQNALRTGKLDDGESSAAKESSKEKKGEVSTIRCGGYQQHPQPQCQQCQPQYHSANFTPPQNTYQYPPPNYTQPQNACQYPVSNTISTALRPNTKTGIQNHQRKGNNLLPSP